MNLAQTEYVSIAVSVATVALLLALIVYKLKKMLDPFFISHMRTKRRTMMHETRKCPTGAPKTLVVFLIGMKINKPWRIDVWLPALLSMSKLMAYLHKNDKKHGFLGNEAYGLFSLLLGYPSMMVQYWNSPEQLIAFSHAAMHYPAWKKLAKGSKESGGAVGFWHELYCVSKFEGVHVYMPEFGIVRALDGNEADAVGENTTSAGRLGIPVSSIPGPLHPYQEGEDASKPLTRWGRKNRSEMKSNQNPGLGKCPMMNIEERTKVEKDIVYGARAEEEGSLSSGSTNEMSVTPAIVTDKGLENMIQHSYISVAMTPSNIGRCPEMNV